MRQGFSVRTLGRLIPLVAIAGALAAPSAASAGPVVDPALTVSDDSVVEHDGAEIWFDVSRSPNTGPSTAQYSIAPGTATAGMDYGTPFDDDANPNDGVLTWPTPGGAADTTIRVTVPVVNDSLFEADEDLFLNLGTVNGSIVNDGQGRGVIVNDDPAPPPTITPATLCGILSCLGSAKFGNVLSNPAVLSLLINEAMKSRPPNFNLILNFLIPGAMNGILNFLRKKGAAASATVPVATASATVPQAGQQQVTWTLTPQGLKLLRKKKKANLTMSLNFTDRAGATATDSLSVPFKNKKKKK